MAAESSFPPLRPALLKLVRFISRSAVEQAKDLGHAARENPVFLGKLLAKAVPLLGFAAAALDTQQTFSLANRFAAWDKTRENPYLVPRALHATVGLIQGLQTAVFTGSSFAYALGLNLSRHHPVASVPFFALGAGAQALGLLMEPGAIPEGVEARHTLQAALQRAERSGSSQIDSGAAPRSIDR